MSGHNAPLCSGAKSVQLKDAKLPAGLSLVDGALTKAIGSLDVGERASHSYVISASKGSKGYLLDAAKVSYLAEIDSKEPQVGPCNAGSGGSELCPAIAVWASKQKPHVGMQEYRMRMDCGANALTNAWSV